jgi:hypothetical protein
MAVVLVWVFWWTSWPQQREAKVEREANEMLWIIDYKGREALFRADIQSE